jgi:BirA family biotin operon repressor/biotin-[acetyl-CoA-carboxylase] ligase
MELEIERHATVTSTMDVALAAAAAGASEGLVVIAATQTQGRGRRGRTWSSPAGAGLYLSIVFRPPADARATSLLTMAAGVAVRGAIARATGVTAQLKWPNDVVVGRRKLAGILAEGLHLGTAEQAVVVGIGINVTGAAHPPDVADRATSLAACGAAIDAGVLEREVLLALAAAYDALCRGEADDILRAWREAAPSAHGSRVEWDAPDGPRAGITSGVDDSGALLVSTPEAVERIVGGELRWI